jgi:osmotically-inducible protein OsmY
MPSRNFLKILAALFMAVFLAACASTSNEASTGEFLDDTVITARVKAALVKDPTVSAIDVSVESFKGAVQLSGFVKSAAERARAVQIANDVPGVTQVFNSIQLR